jgi:hypothetical protein
MAKALSIMRPASAKTSRCALASRMTRQAYPTINAATMKTAPSARLIRINKLILQSPRGLMYSYGAPARDFIADIIDDLP